MITYNLHLQNGLNGLTAPSLYKNEPIVNRIKNGIIQFSFFLRPVQNVAPNRAIGVKEVYDLIASEKYATNTRVLRCLNSPEEARKYKARNFDYCCFSGVFSRRAESGLIQHSGLLTIDFDHVKNLFLLKRKLINDCNFDTILAFISPSGDGLKWIVKIDLLKNTHLEWFTAIQRYVRATYQLEIDKSGKDVSRCCFLPYDPEVYINPKY